MGYEIKSVDADAVTLSDFEGSLMRIITRKVGPDTYEQVPVMRLAAAQRIVRALKLAETLQSVVLSGDSFEGAVLRAVKSAERRNAI